MSYRVRDWIEIRREYLRQLAELEARLVASESANAVNSDEQIERLAQQGGRDPMIVGFLQDIVRGARAFLDSTSDLSDSETNAKGSTSGARTKRGQTNE